MDKGTSSIYALQPPGGKKIPSMGYEMITNDKKLLQTAYSSGCRHVIFHSFNLIALVEWCQENNIATHEIFFTFKVSIHADRREGAQAITVKLIEKLSLTKVDMICLFNDQLMTKSYSTWQSRWLELEGLRFREMTSYIGACTDDLEILEHLCSKCRTTSPQAVLLPSLWGDFSQPEEMSLSQFRDFSSKVPFQLGPIINFSEKDELNLENYADNLKTTLRVLMASKMIYVISSQSPALIQASFEIMGFNIPADTFRQIKTTLHL